MGLLLKGGSVWRQGGFQRCDVRMRNGRIADMSPSIPCDADETVLDVHHCYIVPGFADVHVHFREPGFSYKETIETGTAAAARGGYTAVCTMPNLSPVPDTPEHLRLELNRIAASARVAVHPYASITLGEAGERLVDFAALAGQAVAFSDDGRGVQSRDLMRRAMRAAKAAGGMIVAHCEDNALLRGGYIHDGVYAKRHGHRGICSESEWGPLQRDLELVRETGCAYHACHLSCAESIELIRKAKADGLPVTCETAPHYLILCDEDLQEEGRFKMNPPLRSRADRDALRRGLLDGAVDMIATDHAPHSAEEKSKGLAGSAMGVVGLECAFPVLYTALVQPGLLTLERLLELLCAAPRARFGLGGGAIEIGEAADLTVLDLSRPFTIDPARFLSKGRSTPFAGRQVYGAVRLTVYQDSIVWKEPTL